MGKSRLYQTMHLIVDFTEVYICV